MQKNICAREFFKFFLMGGWKDDFGWKNFFAQSVSITFFRDSKQLSGKKIFLTGI